VSGRAATRAILLAAGSLLVATAAAWGWRPEKVDLSPEQLRTTATHVVVGKVLQVWTRDEESGNWDWTRYVAEVQVEAVEKGDGLVAGQLVYVRYWTKEWDGLFGAPPPDTNGHRGLPSVGARSRIHLARDAYDGFGTTKDGGFNVIGANGFAAP
jgi:hypothetical protein